MRVLLWLVVLAFAGWSGWWWVAAGAAREGTLGLFAALQAQGWQADRDDITVLGYPSRIDLTVTEPRLASPDRGWGWQAPFVQVFALSYKPWHLIAAFAPEQRLASPLGDWRLSADKLRSSLVLVPGPDLALDRFHLAGEGLRLEGPWTTGADHLSLATRPTLGLALTHDIGLEARGVLADPRLLAALPPGVLPDRADLVRLNAEVSLDGALDRHALQALPRITALSLREARADWGPIRASASGKLVPDALGRAEGRIDLRIEGAAAALELALAMGIISPEARPTWERVLRALAPQGQPLDLPVTMARGLVSLGPIPLGPAPMLRN